MPLVASGGQVREMQGGGGADTAVVSATTTTQQIACLSDAQQSMELSDTPLERSRRRRCPQSDVPPVIMSTGIHPHPEESAMQYAVLIYESPGMLDGIDDA